MRLRAWRYYWQDHILDWWRGLERDTRWLLTAFVWVMAAALLVASVNGCAYLGPAYTKAKAVDDQAAQGLKVAICSLPNPAYMRNYRPEEIEALQQFCGWGFAVDCRAALERAKASCAEVGP